VPSIFTSFCINELVAAGYIAAADEAEMISCGNNLSRHGHTGALSRCRAVIAKGYEGEEHFQKYHARRLQEDGLIGQSLE
jgi:hypothetical protein